MINAYFLLRSLNHELNDWKREVPSEHIRGIIYGLSCALDFAAKEIKRQRKAAPQPPGPMSKADAFKLYRHLETLGHMLATGERSKAQRKIAALLDSYKDRACINRAA